MQDCAENARRLAVSQPKDILRTWARSFPGEKHEGIPPLAFLGGHTPQRHDAAGAGSGGALRDLMDIWLAVREWEGFAWLETRYEDLVADLEKEGRHLTGFLGLDWQEGQNRFYEKSRQKQFYSPTYQDVTRPVYARSVGRWCAYEKHLAPILAALAPYCRAFGYG